MGRLWSAMHFPLIPAAPDSVSEAARMPTRVPAAGLAQEESSWSVEAVQRNPPLQVR